MNRSMLALPALLLAGLGLAGCDGATDPEGPGSVIIQLDHAVDGEPFSMHTGTYTNAAGNAYTVSKLEYVLSTFVLEVSAGRVDGAGPHYRDAAEAVARRRRYKRAGTPSLLLPSVAWRRSTAPTVG